VLDFNPVGYLGQMGLDLGEGQHFAHRS
jgi:hypothetical protein